MVDTSGSVLEGKPDNFQLMLDFVKNTVMMFTISSQETLVGIIGFSNDAYLHFNVLEHTSITALLTAIDNLYYHGGFTNTASALELLLNSAQNGTMGLRPGHPHIAILITDGPSNIRKAETVSYAERIHASNIFQSLLVIGISPQVDFIELKAIAGDPLHVLYSMSFDDLPQLSKNLTQTLCDGEEFIMFCFNALHLIYQIILHMFFTCPHN